MPCTRGGCLRLYSAPSQVLQPLRCQPRSAGRSRAYRQASYTAQRQRQYGVGHYRYGMQRGRSGWCVVSRRRSSGCESAARGAGAACGADTQCGRVAQRLRGAVRGKPRARAWRPARFMCVPSGCPSAEKSFNPPALILLLVAVHPPTPPTPRSPHSPPHSSTPRSRSLLPPSRRAAPQCPVQGQVHQAHHRLQHPPLFHAPVLRHSVTRLRAAPLGSP